MLSQNIAESFNVLNLDLKLIVEEYEQTGQIKNSFIEGINQCIWEDNLYFETENNLTEHDLDFINYILPWVAEKYELFVTKGGKEVLNLEKHFNHFADLHNACHGKKMISYEEAKKRIDTKDEYEVSIP